MNRLQNKEHVCFLVFVLGALFFLTSSILIPDTYEIIHLSECLLNHQEFCNDVSWNFRPLLPSILLRPFLVFMDGLMGLRLLCLFSISVAIFSLFQGTRTFFTKELSFVLPLIFLTASTFHNLFSLVDARTLSLGFIFVL